MNKLTKEKELSLAALRKEFENAKSGSNAEVERVRANAARLEANIKSRIARNETTRAEKDRLETELKAARNASAKFEKQLAFVKNEQNRKNAVRSEREKKEIEKLSRKIKELKSGEVRTSLSITNALLSGNAGLKKLAMNRVLNQTSVPSRVHSSKQEQYRQEYIAAHLRKNMNSTNMYELLKIEPTNARIAQFKNPGSRVTHGANTVRPAHGKPSSIGISTGNMTVRGEPVSSVRLKSPSRRGSNASSNISEIIEQPNVQERRSGGNLKGGYQGTVSEQGIIKPRT